MRLHLLLFLVCFGLTACTETQLVSHMAKQFPNGNAAAKQQGNFKVGNPYRVEGKIYTPQETYSLTESGIASWYGPGFHGKRTANGEQFDKNELTAAHRTLQMPSLVRVTNLDNGRSLIVRVNDRGPFKRGRVIDVSQRAAELLGFKNIGTAKVKLQVLTQESMNLAEAAKRGEDTRGVEVAMNEGRYQPISTQPTMTQPTAQPAVYQSASIEPIHGQPLPSPVEGHLKGGEFFPDPVVKQLPVTPSNIYVQAGAFGDQANAARLAESLQSYGNAHAYPAMVNGRQFHRVRIGPLRSVEEADSLLARLNSGGHAKALTVVE
jgi:rare lipoprotein A